MVVWVIPMTTIWMVMDVDDDGDNDEDDDSNKFKDLSELAAANESISDLDPEDN